MRKRKDNDERWRSNSEDRGRGGKSEEEEAGNEKGGRRKLHVRTGAKEAAKTGARAQPDKQLAGNIQEKKSRRQERRHKDNKVTLGTK